MCGQLLDDANVSGRPAHMFEGAATSYWGTRTHAKRRIAKAQAQKCLLWVTSLPLHRTMIIDNDLFFDSATN